VNVAKNFNDITKSLAFFHIPTIKSSQTCKSTPENISIFENLLDCLHLNGGSDLTTIVDASEQIDSTNRFPKFSFQWPNADISSLSSYEALSYEPLLNYLKVNNMNALFPKEDQLMNNLMFDIHIYSLKSDVTRKSKDLKWTGGEPRCRFHLFGRTAIVILTPEDRIITRHTVTSAIEVKPPVFNVKEGLREAAFQLLGFNIDNEAISASVLLTNLVDTHFVLYLEAINVLKQKFKLVIKQYSAFNDAIALVDLLKDRKCITRHFGSPPTPAFSEMSDNVEDDIEDDDENDYLNEELCDEDDKNNEM